jgi:hypothetical protein
MKSELTESHRNESTKTATRRSSLEPQKETDVEVLHIPSVERAETGREAKQASFIEINAITIRC